MLDKLDYIAVVIVSLLFTLETSFSVIVWQFDPI